MWICTSSTNESRVTVIDAVNPSSVIESFIVCSSLILCIASVPGACESDYSDENESNNNIVPDNDNERVKTDDDNNDENSNLGKIKWVSCENVKTETSQNPENGMFEVFYKLLKFIFSYPNSIVYLSYSFIHFHYNTSTSAKRLARE